MGCPPQVRSQLGAMDGVIASEVNYGEKTATVTVRKGTDPQAVANGVKGDFSASVKN